VRREMPGECETLDNAPSKRRQLRRLRTFTVEKHSDDPNEDHSHESPTGMAFALSDGASVSFDPKTWAAILSRRFTEDVAVSHDWLNAAIGECRAAYDRETMPWMQQAALDRGSFATLLGIVLQPDWRAARVFSVGDTLLAFIDAGEVVRTIPYVRSDEFDRSPQLLSTNPLENKWLDEDAITNAWHELNIASHEAPTLLMMTDALGRWLLDQPDPSRVAMLLNIEDEQAFRGFVESERASGRLKRDDTTLVVIGVSSELPTDH
jgi:hypothetical protein